MAGAVIPARNGWHRTYERVMNFCEVAGNLEIEGDKESGYLIRRRGSNRALWVPSWRNWTVNPPSLRPAPDGGFIPPESARIFRSGYSFWREIDRFLDLNIGCSRSSKPGLVHELLKELFNEIPSACRRYVSRHRDQMLLLHLFCKTSLPPRRFRPVACAVSPT